MIRVAGQTLADARLRPLTYRLEVLKHDYLNCLAPIVSEDSSNFNAGANG